MPSRYRPIETWFVDWDGDGNYNNANSEISDDVVFYRFIHGCSPNIDFLEVKPSIAEGSIVIDNEDHKFDPDSTVNIVDDLKLRRKNLIKLEVDGLLEWEGLCSPTIRRGSSIDNTIVWVLEGKNIDKAILNNRIVNTSNLNMTQLAQQVRQTFQTDFNSSSTLKTGLVYETGNMINFLDKYAKFGGGFVIENRIGGFDFTSYAQAFGFTRRAVLGLNYELGDSNFSYAEKADHIRNYAKCRALEWDSSPVEVTLASNSVPAPSGGNYKCAINLYSN